MPRLRVLAGPSPTTLVPITELVNTNKPHTIASAAFEGQIIVHIKGFTDPAGAVLDSAYFARADRQGITWSIQMQGRFLQPHSADDVLFGNTFDRPLKLPWGSGAALKFMSYVDPTLEHDLTSPTQPWALSPLVATMPHLAHRRLAPAAAPPRFAPAAALEDDTSAIHLAGAGADSRAASRTPSPASSSSDLSDSSASSATSRLSRFGRRRGGKDRAPRFEASPLGLHGAAARRAHFADAGRRRRVQFGPEDLITTDFCYGFLEFSPALALRLPGGISFDLMRYWDGQPVRFVCCERKAAGAVGGEPWGAPFWCVTIELADDEGEGGAEGDEATAGAGNDVD